MEENTQNTTDVVIIGAGPVGLFTVFQLGMLKLTSHVFDTLHDIGGQCTALYPEKPIYDIPALPEVNAIDLIAQLQKQIAPFKPIFHLGQQVTEITKNEKDWLITSSTGIQVRAKAIIIAAGAGAFGPNKPALKNIGDYEGKGVYYSVSKRESFKDKRLVIAGGGDSAVDWAISLADLAEKIYVVHRREKFRAIPENVAQMKSLSEAGKIELLIPYQLESLEGDASGLKAVNIISFDQEKQVKRIESDALLSFFGLSARLGPIAQWGLSIENAQINVEPTTCATNIEGIFAVGDIAHYPHKLKLILTGFAEAAQAAHAAYTVVHPDKALHFQHSTGLGLPPTEA